jgi:His-Xaa-Ser system protein HxsD
VAEIVVNFAATSQSLGALREAAYRLIGQATCQIDCLDGTHRCHLEAAPGVRLGEAELRARFLNLVTDENLREKLAAETEPTRNLILALAFGALAAAAEAPTT